MPLEIVRVSPEFIISEEIVHLLTPSHVPPIATQEGPSEMVPPIAYAA